MKQSLKNLSYKRVCALSQNYSMIQNHCMILKIYKVDIDLMDEETEVQELW